MDIATIIGIAGGAACIVMSVLTSGGTLGGIIDIPSVFMTVGGSYAALFILSPLNKAIGLFKVMGKAFKIPDFGEKSLVQNIVNLSDKARREGLLILEDGLEDLDDQFLKSGLRLVIDGTDGAVVRKIMENEMNQTEARHMEWVNCVNQWAGFTLYGSMMANWLLTPFGQNLIGQNSMEMRVKEMVIEGVLAIQAGENSRVIAQKLLTYLDPVTRKAVASEVLKD